MHRRTLVALALVAMALLLVGGVVLAKSISCTAGVTCNGSKKADQITGSIGADTIDGRSGNDTITDADPGVPDVDIITGGKGDDIIDVREGDVNDAPDFVDC